MPSEISIQGLSPVPSPGDTPPELKSEAIANHATPTPAASSQPYLNPSLRLDAALGLVVIEFRDASGSITSSIPSQRQLEAYRQHELASPNLIGSTPTNGSAGAIQQIGSFPSNDRPADPAATSFGRSDSAASQRPSSNAPAIVMPAHKT
jgi:hypothetical protein